MGRFFRSKVTHGALLLLAAVYVYWLMYREYTLKYTYAGAINSVIWRALNAPDIGALKTLSGTTDAELGVRLRASPCDQSPFTLPFPATCDFFGRDLGGKSRNCRFWWLGRNCRVLYLPQAFYARKDVNARLMYALSHPCEVLFDPQTRTNVALTPDDLTAYQQARTGFDCASSWALFPVEIRLHLLGQDGSLRVETIKAQ